MRKLSPEELTAIRRGSDNEPFAGMTVRALLGHIDHVTAELDHVRMLLRATLGEVREAASAAHRLDLVAQQLDAAIS